MDAPKTFWGFVAGVFSEPDGTPSASRVISFASTLVWLTLVAVHFFKTGGLPSATELVAGGAGANSAYLANQAKRLLEPLAAKPPREK